MDNLIVFAKTPVPGRVKTRLCPPLSHDQAARLYQAMARDLWRMASRFRMAKAMIALDPNGRLDADVSWIGDPGAPFVLQQGQDLGARLSHAFGEAFRLGAYKVLVIGTDCPEMEETHLTNALMLLDRKDAVLAPARDGGYTLIGLKRPRPELFEGVDWSTDQVLLQTIERIQLQRLSLGLLPEMEDIDTAQNLESLAGRLRRPGLPGLRDTREAIGEIWQKTLARL